MVTPEKLLYIEVIVVSIRTWALGHHCSLEVEVPLYITNRHTAQSTGHLYIEQSGNQILDYYSNQLIQMLQSQRPRLCKVSYIFTHVNATIFLPYLFDLAKLEFLWCYNYGRNVQVAHNIRRWPYQC